MEYNSIVTSVLEEIEKARIKLKVTERGYEKYSVPLTPNWSTNTFLALCLVWLVYFSWISISNLIAGGDWKNLLVIPGILIAFLVSTIFSFPTWLAAILLVQVSMYYPDLLLFGVFGFYLFSSICRNILKYLAIDVIKRTALGNDDNFILMFKEQAIELLENRFSTNQTKDLISEVRDKANNR